MKVLVIFSYKYSLFTWASVGNIYREMEYYKELSQKKDIEFTFLTYGSSEDKTFLESYKNFNLIPIYEVISKSDYHFVNLIKSFFIPFIIRSRVKDVDLIKCIQLNGSWIGILLKLIIRKPLFIKTGFDAYIFSKNENKSIFKRVLFYLLTQLGLLFSDMYSVASKHDHDFINKKYFFFNKSNLIVRPNWVFMNKKIIKKSKDQYQNRLISIGRLVEQKNYPYIIKSLSNSNYSLDIVGDGEQKEDLIKLAKEYNTNLNLLGNIENNELLDLLPKYKYFILASTFEGNPKVVLESMAAGCIALVSNIPNNEELIIDKVNGFTFDIFDEDHKEIIRIIESNSDEANYEKIREKSIEHVNDKYSFEEACSDEFNDYLMLVNIE